MSRCFPFPPPGYEQKARTDDLDLVKKEKHKEKKHRKEKKDKDKRESKEKREKNRSEGKHKEKKDKKKDKEKHRDKDKVNKDKSVADGKRFSGQSKSSIGDRLIRKENKQNDRINISFEEKFSWQYAGQNGEKFRENAHPAEETRDSKFVQELGRRIKDGNGGAGNQEAPNLSAADHKKDEGTVRFVAKGTGSSLEVKDKSQGKITENRKIEGQGNHVETLPIGDAYFENYAGKFKAGVEGMPRLLEKSTKRTAEGMVEGKEKSKEKKSNERPGDKHKERNKEKKGHGKDKDRDKEKKKEEKVEHKNTQQTKFNETNKANPTDANVFPPPPEDSFKNAVIEENLKKRKEIDSNGVLHANDNWPSKLQRPSSHPFAENGRTFEAHRTSTPYASDRREATTNPKVDSKEDKPNGIIEVQPSSVISGKVVAPSPQMDEDCLRPPHPDIKYLSQVYLVPKLENWSDFDDQEWLFNSSSSLEAKPNVESSDIVIPQVWAEAQQIEAADVYALPYVIPY